MIMKRLKKLKAKKLIKKLKESKEQESDDSLPRITNETIAVHREDVIGRARKYIYPLQHSKHRIILISTSVLILSIIAFFTYCTLALYNFQNSSTFIYRVTQVLPFPVAQINHHFVSYENYLFELRHYTHYYQSQLKLDFNSDSGKQQLAAFKKQAMDKVTNDEFVRELASKYHITVSDAEINDQITIVRDQNRLGSSDKVFEDVLKDYWGWTVDDFKRSLKDQILAQKVVMTLDQATQAKANNALADLNNGADFGATAKQYSDDIVTKNNGGDFGTVDRTNRDLTAQTVEALFKLKPGEHSGIINIGYSLEIVKNIENVGDNKVHGAHILFNFKDISTYTNDLKNSQKTRTFIKV